jgi:hypothetical protein
VFFFDVTTVEYLVVDFVLNFIDENFLIIAIGENLCQLPCCTFGFVFLV